MVKFRFISPSEEKFIQKDINSKFGANIFEKIKNNYQLIVAEGKKKSIFLIPPQLTEIFNKIKNIISPLFLGIHFGDILKNQFKIQISALELISEYSKKYIIVTGKGEQTALYGRNIPLKFVKKVDKQIKKDELIFVRNVLNECIAIGKLLIN
ncbi:MAG: NIP7 N-terminal domain-related protein, partial [Promethearchaeota archaeon]